MTCVFRVLVFALLQFSASVDASTPGDCKTSACASQIDDATAMIQSRAKVSHALQMSEDDPMLLMKSTGVGHMLQAEGSERLAATQKMESSMKNAVTKMINGNYVAPPPEFFEPIETQMELMRTILLGERDGFQTQVNTANANVAQCNTNMETTSDGSVATAKASADALKITHGTCRVAEKAAYDAKTSSCDALASETETVSDAAPQCNCGLSTSDTSAVLACLASNRNWVESSEPVLTTKDSDCDNKTDAWSSKADVCDADQSSYEAAFCTYAEELENMRSTLVTCYNDRISERNSTLTLILSEEAHLKAMLASLKKIVCFLGVIKKAGTENVTMTDFDTCKNMDVLSDTTYLNNSVPDMDITYPPAPAMGEVLTLPMTPGDGQWAAHEYANYTQEWLRDTAVCPHMITTTTADTEAPITTTTTVAPYVYGVAGVDTCPEGYNTIPYKEGCETAAQTLGLPLTSVAEDPNAVCFGHQCLSDPDAGCSDIKFGTSHGHAARFICVKLPYVYGVAGVDNCPEGYNPILDKGACETAAQALGLPLSSIAEDTNAVCFGHQCLTDPDAGCSDIKFGTSHGHAARFICVK